MLAKFSGVVLSYVVKRVREISTFHVAVMQRWLRNVQKSVLLFCGYKPIPFFQFPFPSPASWLKLSIIVIQKFCYHGNVTSHFSFLFNPLNTDTP